VCFYSLTSTLFLYYYCLGFSCKTKTNPTSPVPNIVADTAPVLSVLAPTVFSPPTMFTPSYTVFSYSESCCSEYPSPSTLFSTSFTLVFSPSSTVFSLSFTVSPETCCSEYPLPPLPHMVPHSLQSQMFLMVTSVKVIHIK
jgi:hypothetical protein